MRVHIALFLCGFAASCIVAEAPSQSISTNRASGLWVGDDGPAGIGAGYRVAFDGGRMRLKPALGADAPHGRELRLEYRSIRRGAGVLHERSARRPASEITGQTVVFARGETVRERFEVRADGVALSYVFAERPAGAGDLVVTLELDGDYGLRSHAPDRGGVLLRGEGPESMRIGAVTGIDADGVAIAGSVRVVEGAVELVLPATFVDRARYPMTLDPLIGGDILIGGTTDHEPAVAFDDSRGIYLVVWQRAFSATDIDVYAQRLDRAGNLAGSAFAIAAPATGIAKEPAVCSFQRGSGKFLVVWSQTPALFAAADVYGACVPVAVGPASPAAPLVAAPSVDEVRPRIASRADSSDLALLLWSEEGIGVRGGSVRCPSPTTPPAFVPPVLLTQTAGHTDGAAADTEPGLAGVTIYLDSNSNSSTTAGPSGFSYDLNGNLLARASLGLRGSDVARFAVARNGLEELLVYDVQEVPGANGPRDVYAQKIVLDGSLGFRSVGAPTPIAATPGRDEFDPAVAFLGPKFVIAWSAASATAGGSYELVARTVDPATCLPCGRDEVIGAGGLPFDGKPAIASERSAGGTGDRALIAFASSELVPPFRGEVRAQLFEAIGAGGRVTSVGGGCGNGGTAGLDGPFALGNTDLHVELTGADTVASQAFLMIGLPGPPVSCGNCAVTAGFTFFPSPVTRGAARAPLPVPCQTGLLGGTLELQWWTLPTSSTPCPLVRGMAFSDRLQATIGS